MVTLNKIKSFLQKVLTFILTKILVVVLVLVVLGFLIVPLFYFKEEITVLEIRYYIAIFLVCIIIMCFGVLRIYNSVVINTRYLIYLRNSIQLLMSELRKLRASVEKNSKDLKYNADRIVKEAKTKK